MNTNLVFSLLIFFSFAQSVFAEPVIVYDTLDASNLKVITIDDDLNIEIINEYSYDVYLNDSYLGKFLKGDKIYVSDGSNITIVIPKSNINTDLTTAWDTGKTQFYIATMYLVSGFIIIVIIIYFIRKIWRF